MAIAAQDKSTLMRTIAGAIEVLIDQGDGAAEWRCAANGRLEVHQTLGGATDAVRRLTAHGRRN